MRNIEEGIDATLLAEFIDESLDGLEQVSELFVQLESTPDSLETIQAIFRPVHSIKGNAAYFGLLKTKALAHEMETILDLMRKGALSPTTTVTDVLLRGTDELKTMLARARNQEAETPDLDAFDRLVEEVTKLVTDEKADEESLWRALLADLQTGVGPEVLAKARQLAQFSATGRKALGETKKEDVESASLPGPAHELHSLLSDPDANPNADTVRHLLEECRRCAATPEAVQIANESIADVGAFADSIGLGDPLARDSFLDRLQKMTEAGAWGANDSQATRASIPSDLPKENRVKTVVSPSGAIEDTKSQKPVGKTMRIPEESIDVFLAHIGELVTVGEMYSHLHGNLTRGLDSARASIELRRVNDAFSSLSRSLQESIMNIRKVPMNVILQRAPRMVRDIATAKSKEIETQVTGGELMADKSLVDVLEAPLAHIVRNAADHGIEMPDVRQAAGKPAKGIVEITAVEGADEIVLSVKDDGKGIDRRALAEKAVSLGFITSSDALSEEGVVDLLFQSGVSTAKEVTDVSGRGVGMDVVKRSIERMGGRICVTSTPGEGSQFTVHLPKTVTTQILTGFIVLVGGNRYVFPLESIVRTMRPTVADIATIRGKAECVRHGNQFVRICRLTERFGDEHDGFDNVLERGILVIVETKRESIAVHVDDIEGVRQVVLKDISSAVSGGSLFLGAALMGDGTVALVVDIEQIAASGQSTLTGAWPRVPMTANSG
ncbi:MAG: chemotaxis protein CheA [Pirellulales bacterium]|nr:chemotaxis protein CheA [Pirellulales bacterium]